MKHLKVLWKIPAVHLKLILVPVVITICNAHLSPMERKYFRIMRYFHSDVFDWLHILTAGVTT